MTEQHYPEENFIIKFKKSKSISSIDITIPYDLKDNNISFPAMKILMSDNGYQWNNCEYTLSNFPERLNYKFSNICKGEYLNLIYDEKDPGYWPISEITIYDK